MGGAYHALRIATGAEIANLEINRVEGLALDELEALTGDLREAYLEGRAMEYDEAVAYALAGPTD